MNRVAKTLMAASALTAFGECAIAAPIRIMPLGDSITRGLSSGQGGYRPLLQAKLASAGFNADAGGFDFVGPYPSVTTGDSYAGTGWASTPPAGTDLDHYGYAGRAFNDYTRAADRPVFQNLLAGYPADIVLFHLGTNDVAARSPGQSAMTSVEVDRLRASLTQVLGDLYTAMPAAQVIMAKIIGDAQAGTAPDANRDSRIRQLNEDVIQTVFAQQRAIGRDILLVNMYDALPRTSAYYADGVHPTAAGYAKMADVWFDAIVPEPSVAGITTGVACGVMLRRRRARTR